MQLHGKREGPLLVGERGGLDLGKGFHHGACLRQRRCGLRESRASRGGLLSKAGRRILRPGDPIALPRKEVEPPQRKRGGGYGRVKIGHCLIGMKNSLHGQRGGDEV